MEVELSLFDSLRMNFIIDEKRDKFFDKSHKKVCCAHFQFLACSPGTHYLE